MYFLFIALFYSQMVECMVDYAYKADEEHVPTNKQMDESKNKTKKKQKDKEKKKTIKKKKYINDCILKM